MKFIIAFSCLIAVASAVPVAVYSPAAVTYQSQKQYLAPVGVQTYTTVHKAAPIVSVSAPVLAAPLAAPVYGAHLGAPLAASVYGGHLGAPLAASVYGGLYGAPLAAPYAAAPLGYSKTILGGPAVLAGPHIY